MAPVNQSILRGFGAVSGMAGDAVRHQDTEFIQAFLRASASADG
jgi:hypothetical protein